jgi:hypothetical protein
MAHPYTFIHSFILEVWPTVKENLEKVFRLQYKTELANDRNNFISESPVVYF